jgi:hypothetical protein
MSDCGHDHHDDTDPLTAGIKIAAQTVMESYTDDDWEQLPSVYVFAHSAVDGPEEIPEDVLAEHPGATHGMALMVTDLKVPGQMWTQIGEPYVVLQEIAKVVAGSRDQRPEAPDMRIVAVMFVAEAWMVARPQDAKPDRWRKKMGKHLGKLHAHPDRVEVRIGYVVDAGGDRLSLTHERGQDEVIVRRGDDVVGRIPEAIAELVTAFVDDVDDELASFTRG